MFQKFFFYEILFSSFIISEPRLLLKKIMNENRLKKFYKCIQQKQPNIGTISLDLISSLINSTQKTNFTKYQELFTNNFNKIKDCVSQSMIPHFPDGTKIININVILKPKYNWAEFASCLAKKAGELNSSPFQRLINYIKDGEYYNAIREEFKLRNNGNMIVRQCMATKIKNIFK